MKNYLLNQPTPVSTPQSLPIPGRESEMQRNSAGGFAFTADSFTRMERFLILGSEGGTYYVGEGDLTKANVNNVRACIKSDGRRAVEMIVQISEAGRAPKNDPALYALALAASADNPETRSLALAALPKVARIGTHLFSFCAYVSTMRGWGPGLRKAVAKWYTARPTDQLAYQLVKYQQRNGWSHRDVLRLAHVEGQNTPLMRWAIGATAEAREVTAKRIERKTSYPVAGGELPAIIQAFEATKSSTRQCACITQFPRPDGKPQSTCEDCGGSGAVRTAPDEVTIRKLIAEHGLTHEMIPTQHLKSPAVWEALLAKMPVAAMVRSLGRMGACGLLAPLSEASKTVTARLGDRDMIRAARLHPIALLSALLTYQAGRGQKGSLEWTVVPQVVDALNDAFYLAFEYVEPTGKNFLLGVDVSGSMTAGAVAGTAGLTPNMGAAAMAMLIARTEPNYFIGGFSTSFVDLGISAKDRLDSAMRKAQRNFGGTDCAVAIKHALAHNIPVDAFVIITDGETWAGDIHASLAIVQYRQKMGRDARLITMNMVANRTRLTDPTDAGSMDVVGFDASVPQIINQFIA